MLIRSYTKAVAAAQSDSVNQPEGDALALWIGVAGTLKFTPVDPALAAGGTPVATTVPAGLFPVAVKRVWSTGTAATGIVALY